MREITCIRSSLESTELYHLDAIFVVRSITFEWTQPSLVCAMATMPNAKRPRILLLIPHLGGGGAEHVIETLAHCLNREKYEVHLGLITGSVQVPAGCAGNENIHELNASRIRYSVLKLLRLIWKIRPDLILSGIAHLNLLVLLLGPALPRATRIFIRQNGALSATLAAGMSPRISHLIYRVAYRRADLVICQSESMKREIQCEFRVDEAKLAVLANPVDSDLIRRIVQLPDNESKAGLQLIAVGRLVPEKGFDLLLDAFAQLCGRFADAELIIAGVGPNERLLKRQSEKLGIANRVCFVGHIANPAWLLRDASLFVLSSRTEGIPNALLEAAVSGLPIVTTPASGGLTDLLGGKEGVWIADEVSAGALRDALESALGAIGLGQRYSHEWIRPFELGEAIRAYEAAIDGVIEENAR